MIQIKNPELLNIKYNGRNHYGGDQAWYKTPTQRLSGCGPTVCSGMMLYCLRRGHLKLNVPNCNPNNSNCIFNLMNTVWEFVCPGKLGINSTEMFVEGFEEYTKNAGFKCSTKTLNISKSMKCRPSYDEVRDFVKTSLKDDSPIAFLNLSNGDQYNLESWHWVMIVGIEDNNAVIYDQGIKKTINLNSWLNTSLLGGGFVSIIPHTDSSN